MDKQRDREYPKVDEATTDTFTDFYVSGVLEDDGQIRQVSDEEAHFFSVYGNDGEKSMWVADFKTKGEATEFKDLLAKKQ